MAIYFDKYEINIKLDNKDFDIDPSQLSFSIKDSINSLYPMLTINIKDIVGYFQEYLLTMESMPIEIAYGLNTDYLTCPFVLVSEEIADMEQNYVIAGNNLLQGIHAFYDTQEITSAGYKNKVSNIIRQLAGKYKFKSINIEDTIANTYWYQPLITDAEFMERFLLPNCYSNNSQQSPFFMFINSKNEFYLKSYYNMIKAKPSKKFYNLHETLDDIEDNVLTSFKKFKPGSIITKRTRNRNVFEFSKTDGSLIESEDGITSYPNNLNNKKYPLYKDSKISSTLELWEEKTTSGDKEYINALKINSMKDSLFLEKFILTTYLDTSLCAGQTIELEIPHFNSKDNKDLSPYFSDKLLIEESEHVWDSVTNKDIGRGYTQLICSRKALPTLNASSYQMTEKLQSS